MVERRLAHPGREFIPDERTNTIKPPKPPSARYIDHDGAPWIIDDRFLALLDGQIERLQKCLRAK